MKFFLLFLIANMVIGEIYAIEPSFFDRDPQEEIQLNKPSPKRGSCIMEAFANRKSTKSFSDKILTLQEISDLLWAANGINRPNGKRTAPSAMNSQDIRIYVCVKNGNYLYDHEKHALTPLSKYDVRPVDAPIVLVLVADQNGIWPAIDTGIVSQNISIFCSGVGLATHPHGFMDKKIIKQALQLTESQIPFLCHPVGYFE